MNNPVDLYRILACFKLIPFRFHNSKIKFRPVNIWYCQLSMSPSGPDKCWRIIKPGGELRATELQDPFRLIPVIWAVGLHPLPSSEPISYIPPYVNWSHSSLSEPVLNTEVWCILTEDLPPFRLWTEVLYPFRLWTEVLQPLRLWTEVLRPFRLWTEVLPLFWLWTEVFIHLRI